MEDAPRVRLLFVLSTLTGGGSERRMVDLLQRLDRQRFQPELYLAYRTGELLGEVPADVPIHCYVDGPVEKTWRQKLAGKFRLLSEARAADISRQLRRRNIDVMFTWGLRHAYEAAYASRIAGVPYIASCAQDPIAELRTDSPFITPWRWWFGRWAYSSANRILANSEALGRRLEDFYRLPAGTVRHFPNLRDFTRIERLAGEKSIDWPGPGTRLLSVGRLSVEKGHALLIDAVAELVRGRGRDVSLVIVGQGPLESELQAQAERLGLADRVHLVGFQQNPFPYFKAAEIFILPSLREGLPNTLIEALALGLPVVSADCPTGPREILEDGKYGTLVPVGDAAALAAAVDQALARMPAEISRAKSAQEAMRRKYDVDIRGRDLENQFLELVKTHRTQRPAR